MDAKDYLSQLFIIDKIIQADKEEIERLETLLYSPKGITYGERVQTSSNRIDRYCEILDKIDDATQRLQNEINHYLTVKENVKCILDELSDDKVKLVLRLRYIELLKWTDIADRLDCTLQWVHKLHSKGLREFDKKLNSLF